MLKRSAILAILAAVFASTVGCEAGTHSSKGFRLPEGGDAARGKVAFAELKCNSCHEVAGVTDLGKPTVQPPVPVVLGGEVRSPMPDGYLVTAIINPSHALARGPMEQIAVGGRSRMPDYDQITVRQLNDLIAFLQSRYTVLTVPTYAR
jgi:hypothetical protein